MARAPKTPPLPPGCPYGDGSGGIAMICTPTGQVDKKVHALLYELHLPLGDGKFRKHGKLVTFPDAARIAGEHRASVAKPARAKKSS